MMYNITININFKDKATRDHLFNTIRTQKTNMVPGHSTFSKHLCTHDVLPYQPCTEEETVIVAPPPPPSSP